MDERRVNQNNQRKKAENKKRMLYYRVLFIVIAVLIIVLDIIFFVLPDKELSETENRTLQQFPKLNFTTLTNGKFESRFDSYVADQFPGRNGWVGLKSTVDIFSGKTENNRIYLGKDGYLIQDLTLPDEEAYQAKIEEIRSFVSAHSNLVSYAMIAPTALSVLSDHLPANAPATDEDAFYDKVKSDLASAGLRVIDPRSALKNAASEDQVYYRTDHHWTTYGAYIAYKTLAEELQLPGKDRTYEKEMITDSFSGTLTASSGFRTSETDKVYVYIPQPEENVSVYYASEGIRSASFYKTENLEVRDKYTVFFNGNHPQIKIETASTSTKVLLVIKDSYANCFVPFLAADYQKIIMIDPRYYTDDIETLMTTEGITDILYLYNISTFGG